MNRDCKKVRASWLQQDVYVREIVPTPPDDNDYIIDAYVAQDIVTDPSGCVRDDYHVESYPITPESVASYAAGSDYRLDPTSAVARSSPGKNLGDVRGIQDLLTMDKADFDAAMQRFRDMISTAETARVVAEKEDSNG